MVKLVLYIVLFKATELINGIEDLPVFEQVAYVLLTILLICKMDIEYTHLTDLL